MNSHGFNYSEEGNLEDLSRLTEMFVKNGFAESLEIIPTNKGNNFIWKNLFGLPAYKELYDIALNPFLSCPLNLCLYYVAGKQKKKFILHKKEFNIPDGVTETEYEIVDDDTAESSLDDLVLKSAKLYDIAHEREITYHQQAMTDPLTGLYNRRYIMEVGLRIFQNAQKNKTPFSVLMIDIVHFKKVNDDYGHGFGDQVLIILAEICQNTIRDSDIVGRLGGEEFTIILPHTALSGAIELAERLKQEVENFPLKIGDHIFNVTVSIGATSYSDVFERFEDVLHTADMEMYKAKKLGRNRIVASS